MKLIQCKACNKEISPNAKVCPGCGEKQKKSKLINWIIAAAIVGTGLLVITAANSSGVPECDSSEGIQNAKAAVANGSLAQMLHVSIEEMNKIRQVSYDENAGIRVCLANASTNNGNDFVLRYSFKRNGNGEVIVEASEE